MEEFHQQYSLQDDYIQNSTGGYGNLPFLHADEFWCRTVLQEHYNYPVGLIWAMEVNAYGTSGYALIIHGPFAPIAPHPFYTALHVTGEQNKCFQVQKPWEKPL